MLGSDNILGLDLSRGYRGVLLICLFEYFSVQMLDIIKKVKKSTILLLFLHCALLGTGGDKIKFKTWFLVSAFTSHFLREKSRFNLEVGNLGRLVLPGQHDGLLSIYLKMLLFPSNAHSILGPAAPCYYACGPVPHLRYLPDSEGT